MNKRLVLAAVSILVLPFWFSDSPGNKTARSAPAASVAYGGHIVTGGWCACGTEGCICDAGEAQIVPRDPVSDQTEPAPRAGAFEGQHPTVDFGTGALMLVAALLVWSRMRA